MLPIRLDCEFVVLSKFCANLVGKVTVREAIEVAQCWGKKESPASEDLVYGYF